jgi:hypothetical protein
MFNAENSQSSLIYNNNINIISKQQPQRGRKLFPDKTHGIEFF